MRRRDSNARRVSFGDRRWDSASHIQAKILLGSQDELFGQHTNGFAPLELVSCVFVSLKERSQPWQAIPRVGRPIKEPGRD
jgi:hypothetical protein